MQSGSVELGCVAKLKELDRCTSELRARASSLSKREAERAELLERAEMAWRDLELGYQRRLRLAEEKEEQYNIRVLQHFLFKYNNNINIPTMGHEISRRRRWLHLGAKSGLVEFFGRQWPVLCSDVFKRPLTGLTNASYLATAGHQLPDVGIATYEFLFLKKTIWKWLLLLGRGRPRQIWKWLLLQGRRRRRQHVLADDKRNLISTWQPLLAHRPHGFDS